MPRSALSTAADALGEGLRVCVSCGDSAASHGMPGLPRRRRRTSGDIYQQPAELLPIAPPPETRSPTASMVVLVTRDVPRQIPRERLASTPHFFACASEKLCISCRKSIQKTLHFVYFNEQ